MLYSEVIVSLLKKISRTQVWIIVIIFILFFSLAYFIHTPKSFPIGSIVTILPGKSVTQITSDLYNKHVIGSKIIFQSTIIFLGGEKKVIAGDYLLDKRESATVLAYRLLRGSFHLTLVKLTIPEGWNVFQIRDYLSTRLSSSTAKDFLTLAKKHEGYLFPDTYFVSPITTSQELIALMRANFDAKTAVTSQSHTLIHSFKDIIVMASIVEGEASTTKSRKIVAGILWKRLSIGMPLQVDSSFKYVNGKNTYELTKSDLKINSPYNTYIHLGLPPAPISNPGLDSIRATVAPTETLYLYFFSGQDGMMYYAKTYAEHRRNILKYGSI